MAKLDTSHWFSLTVHLGRQPVTVKQSPDGNRFKLPGCIGTIDKRGRAFAVRWKEAQVRMNARGESVKAYKKRRQAVSTLEAGAELLLTINAAHDAGSTYTADREQAVATLAAIIIDYLDASQHGRPTATIRYRASVLQKFLDYAGEDRLVTDLSTGLLSAYGKHLALAGISSVSRYVGLVEQLWRWAHNRNDAYAGVPEPRRINGSDGDIPHRQAPAAVDTPTWGDVDAMLHALTREGAPQGKGKGFGYRPQWALTRKVAIVQRFSGLRISQIVGLNWKDVDLERRWLYIRAGRAGAKGQSRDRVVPMHRALAEHMASWGVREGAVFSRIAVRGKHRGEHVSLRGSEVADVFKGAWKRAGVAEEKWGAVGGRQKARPTNAIRARWKSSIAGAAGYDLASMMVGQSTRNEHDAYVAMGNPDASPYWDAMVKALEAVPAAGETAAEEREIRQRVRRIRQPEMVAARGIGS